MAEWRRWRVGRKIGRTIYRQVGEEPSDNDHFIGIMDTPGLAREVVAAMNAYDPNACLEVRGCVLKAGHGGDHHLFTIREVIGEPD